VQVSIHWNEERIRIYDINGVPMPSVTTICSIDPKSKIGIEEWKKRIGSISEIISKFKATEGTIVHYLAANYAAEKWGYSHVPLDIEYGSDEMNIIQTYYDEFKTISGKTGRLIGVRGHYGESVYKDVNRGFIAYHLWFAKRHPKPPIHNRGKMKGDTFWIHPCEHVVHHKLYRYAGTADLICNIDGLNYLVDLKFNSYNKSKHRKYLLQLTGYRLAINSLYPTMGINKVAILYLGHKSGKPEFISHLPNKQIEKDWLRYVGAYYYKNRSNSRLSENAIRVTSILKTKKIEIIKNFVENWRDYV